MRWEFQLHALPPGAPSDRGVVLVDTSFDVLKAVCELAEGPHGPRPAWAEFFMDHRLILAPYPPSPAGRGPFSGTETLAALEGMSAALSRHAEAWQADPRWVRSWGTPRDLVAWLGEAAEAVRKEPAGTLFQAAVQDD